MITASMNTMLLKLLAATTTLQTPAEIPSDVDIPESGFWMPSQSSDVAPWIDFVFNFITWLSAFFFVAIVGTMIYLVVKYRRSGHDPNPHRPSTHNTPIELAWTLLPLVIVIAMFYVGMRGYVKLRYPPPDAYEVEVTASKWSWSFKHPNGAISGELHIPAGRPVKLTMKSLDVLHSLFIPAFRVKQDVVPGRYNYLWFNANDPADGKSEALFDLYCTEYCGTGHSEMITQVHVFREEDFPEKIEEVAVWWPGLSQEQMWYETYNRIYGRCKSCHSLEDDGGSGTGPSWHETNALWGEERTFLDGSKRIVDDNYVRDSIINPAKEVVDGRKNVMSTFINQLKEEEVEAVKDFIKNLHKIKFGPDGKPVPPPADATTDDAGAGDAGGGN